MTGNFFAAKNLRCDVLMDGSSDHLSTAAAAFSGFLLLVIVIKQISLRRLQKIWLLGYDLWQKTNTDRDHYDFFARKKMILRDHLN